MSPRAGLDRHTLVIRAADIADDEGIEAVTLAALAGKLGVRSPSLYNHINGLQVADWARHLRIRVIIYKHVERS